MNDKIERMRYLNLKQNIDALHLAKLLDDAEALHLLKRLQEQVGPMAYSCDEPKTKINEVENGKV